MLLRLWSTVLRVCAGALGAIGVLVLLLFLRDPDGVILGAPGADLVLGFGALAVACWLGILGRLAQAREQHAELLMALRDEDQGEVRRMVHG